MSKNVIVNGESYNSISTVALTLATGGTALFRDADEVSGGGIDGVVAIAVGSFIMPSTAYTYTIKHGMSVKPDVAVVIPKHFYDTIDNNHFLGAVSQHAYAAVGRQKMEGSTNHFNIGIIEDKITDTDIIFSSATLARFQPNYTDDEGNTGTQEYLWLAVKFAE